MSAISPPLTPNSSIASLSGWTLILHCPKCGLRKKPTDDLFKKVHRSRTIGEVLPRLTCDVCRSRPTVITAECTWIRKFRRNTAEEIDLTQFLQRESAAA